MRKKIIITVVVLVCLILGSKLVDENLKEDDGLPDVSKQTLKYFKKNCKYKEIITYAEEDVNGDDKKDLAVIYKNKENHNRLVVVATKGNKYYVTEPVAAPVDDQVITFKDIDSKGVMEIMVSGSKNKKIGYAIYRLEGNKLEDLFGENMESCC